MRWTRLSLFYLAGYLLPAGLGFLLVPDLALKLLLSNGEYGETMPRFVGMFMLGLFIIIAQLIRLRAEMMYSTTILVRVLFCACLIGFWTQTHDPLFLSMLAIVGVGAALTMSGIAFDAATGHRAGER